MLVKSTIGIWAGLLAFIAVPVSGTAQTTLTPGAPKQIGATATAKPEIVPSLIVLSARSASMKGSTLTLLGVAPNVVIFADRPVRSAGHALTAHLLDEWKPGSGDFATDPPNATVSVFSSAVSLANDAVVVLTSPKLEGDTLTFTVRLLEGDLSGADGPASVFIDMIGLPFLPIASSHGAIDF